MSDLISRRDAMMEARPEYLNPNQKGHEEYNKAWNDAVKAYWNGLKELPSEPVGNTDRVGWIPCSERLPECEQEVLVCTELKLVGRDAYIDLIVTPAIYEDGTMLEVDSMWHWEDMDFDEWDDTEDCGIIPEGWFENRHFNPEDVFNNPIDRKVVAWMPLPEPYSIESDGVEEGNNDTD